LSIRFQADADLRYTIVKAVRQREPSIDFASAFESRLEGVSDSEILDRAASEGRILVTHDRRTMLAYFRARLEAGSGVFYDSSEYVSREYGFFVRFPKEC